MGMTSRIAGVFLAAGMLTAIATQSFADDAADYLVIQSAVAEGDYGRAYDVASETIMRHELDDPALQRRMMEIALGADDVNLAIELAEEYGLNDDMARILLFANSIRNDDLPQAEERLSDLPRGWGIAQGVALVFGQQQGWKQDKTVAADLLNLIAEEAARGSRSGAIPLLLAQIAKAIVPENASSLLLIAQWEIKRENYDVALDYLSRIESDHPAYAQAQLQKGWALAGMEDYERAEAAMVEAFELSTLPEQRLAAKASYAQFLFSMQERYEDAVQAFTEALDLSDGGNGDITASLLYSRAVAYDKVERKDLAERDLLRLLEQSPDDYNALNYLGYMWANQGVNLEEAEAMLVRANDLTGGRQGYIVDSYGWALYNMGRYEEAAQVLQKAVELDPAVPEILYHYAESLAALGLTREAQWEWNRVITVADLHYPDDESAAKFVTLAKQRLAQQQPALEPSLSQ